MDEALARKGKVVSIFSIDCGQPSRVKISVEERSFLVDLTTQIGLRVYRGSGELLGLLYTPSEVNDIRIRQEVSIKQPCDKTILYILVESSDTTFHALMSASGENYIWELHSETESRLRAVIGCEWAKARYGITSMSFVLCGLYDHSEKMDDNASTTPGLNPEMPGTTENDLAKLPVSLYGSPWADQIKNHSGAGLSDRALVCPTHAHAEKLDNMLCPAYDVHHNPEGVINLGLAENALMAREYIEYFGKALKNGLNPIDMGYGDRLSGSARLQDAIADMFNENFSPLQPVLPEQIITGTGCSTILDQLSWAVLNPGDVVLIAAPYYAGFDANMVSRSGAHVVPVHVGEGAEAVAPESLLVFEDALKACKDEGREVKAVLLCNPHNPLGIMYPRETLLAYAEFAEKHNLHLISDEIYALSVYDNPNIPNSPGFISFLSLDVEKETGRKFDKSRVHIVYAFSKDFGVNGLRVGCVISQHNSLLIRSMLHTCFLMKASTYCREWFRERGLYAYDTVAGHFMFVDFREQLKITTFDEEKQLSQRLVNAGVSISSGAGYHCKHPGLMRVTFSGGQEALKLGLQRIEKELGLKMVKSV